MLFDTHTHPYITFKKSPESILEHFFWDDPKNICISVGCDIKTSLQSIELAKKYPWNIYASIGYHPCDIDYKYPGIPVADLRELYERNRKYIVAVWETGLDYYHLASISERTWLWEELVKDRQEIYFRSQISLARELELPFIIHSRESNSEVLQILKEENAHNYVFHCYSWDWKFAENILRQNPQAMFGLWGVLTFKKSQELHEVACKLPLKNILLETDAPFLTPEPLRGREENETLFVSYVLKKLQELRAESDEEIEKTVYENAKSFYRV